MYPQIEFSTGKNCQNDKFFISLHHENPPSLSTMLKCAGRFFYTYISSWQQQYHLVNNIQILMIW